MCVRAKLNMYSCKQTRFFSMIVLLTYIHNADICPRLTRCLDHKRYKRFREDEGAEVTGIHVNNFGGCISPGSTHFVTTIFDMSV